MVFGIFKSKQSSLSEENLIREIWDAEDSIAKIYGIAELTLGSRLRLKLSILCTIMPIVILSTADLQKKKYFIDKTVNLFGISSQKIQKVNISEIFTAKDGWIGRTIRFDVDTFTSSSEFHDENIWTNGYGAFSELIAVFGDDAMNWVSKTIESEMAIFTLMRDLTNEGRLNDPIQNMIDDEKIQNHLIGLIAKLTSN